MTSDVEQVHVEPEDGELVHWMEPKPLTLGLGGISAATLAAFAFGALAAVGVMVLVQRLGDDTA